MPHIRLLLFAFICQGVIHAAETSSPVRLEVDAREISRKPLHLENVKGPTNYASLVGALACLLKNPNLCTDTYSQRSNELEIKAVTALLHK